MEKKTEITGKKGLGEPNVIPTEVIQSQVDNYRNNQLMAINETLGIDDANAIWFDMVTLKKFIADIEKEACDIDPDVTTKDLGIRFYYAAYPEEPQYPIPADYARRHTLIMVPTKKKDDLNYDFNPYEDMGHALAVTLEVSGRAVAQNHGALIPPGTSIVESY